MQRAEGRVLGNPVGADIGGYLHTQDEDSEGADDNKVNRSAGGRRDGGVAEVFGSLLQPAGEGGPAVQILRLLHPARVRDVPQAREQAALGHGQVGLRRPRPHRPRPHRPPRGRGQTHQHQPPHARVHDSHEADQVQLRDVEAEGNRGHAGPGRRDPGHQLDPHPQQFQHGQGPLLHQHLRPARARQAGGLAGRS